MSSKRIKPGPIPKDPIIRFMSKVEMVTNSGCWIWMGASTGPERFEHGEFWMVGDDNKRGGPITAYRASWMLFRHPIPEGMQISHRCDTPLCVNPNHLWVSTQAENIADMWKKGRGKGGCAVGDLNGSRTKPHRVPRGDSHYMRRRFKLRMEAEAAAPVEAEGVTNG